MATNREPIAKLAEAFQENLKADDGAQYDQVIEINLSELEPQVGLSWGVGLWFGGRSLGFAGGWVLVETGAEVGGRRLAAGRLAGGLCSYVVWQPGIRHLAPAGSGPL